MGTAEKEESLVRSVRWIKKLMASRDRLRTRIQELEKALDEARWGITTPKAQCPVLDEDFAVRVASQVQQYVKRIIEVESDAAGRRLKPFPPLKAEHPAVVESMQCQACKEPFVTGAVVTLICLGPGDDAEEQQKAREGRVYTGVAAFVHWSCATGEIDA